MILLRKKSWMEGMLRVQLKGRFTAYIKEGGSSLNRILIVEDDRELMEGLCFSFREDGYEVVQAFSRHEAEAVVRDYTFDLILLDWNLPDGTGFAFFKKLRTRSEVPVIMLTARDAEMDEIQALNLGVDDYIRKPFSLGILNARMKKILRRKEAPGVFQEDGIVIDQDSSRIYRDGRKIQVTSMEHQLLLYLMKNKGRILSKEQILAHIWDRNGQFPDDNIVSVNIRRLRMKIEDDPANPKYIQTVYGAGYIWRNI